MKSLTIKIPLSIAQQMDDRGQLNPQWITLFLTDFLTAGNYSQPITELTYNYTLKVENKLHKKIKLLAIENNLPMNELVGRLISECYYYG